MTQIISTTSQVKENNKTLILETLASLKQATKIMMAKETGLSVATCNTLLNELARENKIMVVPQDKKPTGAGRPSKTYCLNAASYTICCLSFMQRQGVAMIGCSLYNSIGVLIETREISDTPITYDSVKQLLESLQKTYDTIQLISVGIDGNIDIEGYIQNSSITSMNGINLIQDIGRDFGLPVVIEKEINLIASGFHKQLEDPTVQNIVALSFADMKCTAAAFIINGEPVQGKDNAAGDVTLLNQPSENSSRGLFRSAAKTSTDDIIPRIISTFIQLLNPDMILLTGPGVNISLMGTLSNACSRYIPEEHMPEFSYIKDTTEYYSLGLLELSHKIQ